MNVQNVVVLDTSVLLAEGKRVLYRFPDTTVVIPMTVIKELEDKKSAPDLMRPARSVFRAIDEIKGDLPANEIAKGIPFGENSILRIEPNNTGNATLNDDKIVNVASHLNDSDDNVTLATRDLSLALKANIRGINTTNADYDPEARKFIDKVETLQVDWEQLDELYDKGSVRLDLDVPLNTGIVLESGTSGSLVIAKSNYCFETVGDQKIVVPGMINVSGKSKEQKIAISLLKDNSIKFVSLGGIAGGGKTMLALAQGAAEVLGGNDYKKITVFRSMQSVGGEEMGFLPGTEAEKMDPWTAAIYDSLGAFMNTSDINKLKTRNAIEVLPITHVRGRTFNSSWIIVDEAQNLEKSTLLTLLTRVGSSSKIIMTHDISQRDNHRVGRYGGIYEVVSRFHGNKLFGHVSMQKSERSLLAQTATELLDDF